MSPDILLGVIKGMALVMGVMLSIMAFLLVREVSQKDKLRSDQENLQARVVASTEALKEAIAGLTLAIEEIRMWSTDRFVHQTDYDREMKEVKTTMRTNAERADKDRRDCELRCRRGED